MKRKAVISIISNNTKDKDEAIEVRTLGLFGEEEGYFFAEYEETEMSGMEGTTSRIEVYPNKIIMSREGTTTTKMEFEKNKKNVTMYNTPYGTLEMHIATKELSSEVSLQGGDVSIDYEIRIAGQKAQKINLEIKIKA